MIHKEVQAHIPTKFGDFDMIVYTSDLLPGKENIALVHREMNPDQPVSLRIHSECLTGDLFGSSRCDCGDQLHESLGIINRDKGVLIYLRQEGRGIGLINKLKAYNLQDKGLNTIEANIHLGLAADAREYDIAVSIMKDLNISRARLITNNPEKIAAIDQSDIDIVERIPIIIKANIINQPYLNTKKDLMGHLLD